MKNAGITGPSSYSAAMSTFGQHWLSGNTKLGPTKHFAIALLNKTTVSQVAFAGLRSTLLTQENAVQAALTNFQLARGTVLTKKNELLPKFGLFTSILDGYYQGTHFIEARPYAPSFNDGKENFLRPLGAMMTVWLKMNEGGAPPGVSLPVLLGDNTDQGSFASALSSLCFAFGDMENKEVLLQLARGERNVTLRKAYEVMKFYREVAPGKYTLHPEMIETMPRLTPLPGHTPERVNASAMFEAPNESKIVHDASTDAMLSHYELRGNAGDDYSEHDAMLIASHEPGEPMEFLTSFALTQPGAKAAFKVFVVLTTGNEAGSAEMVVQRPVALPLAA